jgi:hypothetical protein
MTPLRASRIAELLAAKATFTEPDFLAMQLDTRTEGYVPDSRRAARGRCERRRRPAARTRPRARARVERTARTLINRGSGSCSSTIRALLERVLTPLFAPAVAADPGFVYRWPLATSRLRRLLDERPAHLLTSEFADWPTFLRAVLLDALHELERDGSRPSVDARWGDVNVIDVAHPFANLPVIGDLLGRGCACRATRCRAQRSRCVSRRRATAR